MGVPMTGPESSDDISALLTLECPNHHYCGQLITHRGHGDIDYRNVNGVRLPWTTHIFDGFFGLPTCPGGCEYEVAEMPERLQVKLNELADNPDEDQGSYTLPFLGPPRELGRIGEVDS
jgi:hypothetical protein